jgi:hypothetical protein
MMMSAPAPTRRTDMTAAPPTPLGRRLTTIGRWLIVIYFALALSGAISGRHGLLASLYFG